jgi:5-methylcytosine-specific restriction protein B
MPNPALLKEIKFNGFNLSEVLKTINERIEVLLDRDHTIVILILKPTMAIRKD